MSRNDLRDRVEGSARRKKKKKPFDVAINWAFILGLTAFSFTLIAYHLDQFRDETWFYNMVQDGLQPDDVDKIYQKEGLVRNMKYKGYSKTDFKIAVWKYRIPRYLFLLFLPIAVAAYRALRKKKPSSGLNITYFSLMGLAIVHAIYSVGGINSWW